MPGLTSHPQSSFEAAAPSSVVALILHPGSNGLSTILVRNELFPLPRGHIGEDIGRNLLVSVDHLLPQVHGEMVPRLIGDVLFEALESSQYRLEPRGAPPSTRPSPATYNLLKDALVEFPLIRSALPVLVVVVVEALPVAAELFQAVRVDVLEPWLSVSA